MKYVFSPDDAFEFARMVSARTKRSGKELVFRLCPYCQGGRNGKDKDTFSISMTTGQFECKRMGCGRHGNMITLAKDFDFELTNYDVNAYNGLLKKHYRRFSRPATIVPKDSAIEYMKSRGISADVVRKYELTMKKDADNILVFPFRDESGELVFIKYRKTDFLKGRDSNKEWCESDCKPILFGMNHCSPDQSNTLVLTEGQIDSLSVAEAGIANAVSVPMGVNNYKWYPYCFDFLRKYKTLVVFGDHEHGHITLLEPMRSRFAGMVKYVQEADYKDCKDANELLQKHGIDAVRHAIENAVPVPVAYLRPLSSVSRQNLSDKECIDTGFPQLNKIIHGFYMGTLCLLTGYKGEGKSVLLSQIVAHIISQNYRVCFYSGELSNEDVKEWLFSQLCGKKYLEAQYVPQWRSYTYIVPDDCYMEINRWLNDRVYIYDADDASADPEDNADSKDLLETMKNSIMQYGCRVLVIDNLMTAMDDADLSSDQYRMQTVFAKKLTVLAKKYNVLIFLVVHPRKKSGADFDADSIMGSSNITNLAHYIFRYSRPKADDDGILPDNPRQLEVLKNRLTGNVTEKPIPMYYEAESRRISDNIDFSWYVGWESDIPHEFAETVE